MGEGLQIPNFPPVLLGFSVAYVVGYGEVVPQLALVGDAFFVFGRIFIGGPGFATIADASFWGASLVF
ncbi:hypothetical protein Pmar_PMAR014902, partial [Perkinsus marinus ATCC 50983]